MKCDNLRYKAVDGNSSKGLVFINNLLTPSALKMGVLS